MKTYEAAITISSSPKTVWSILSDPSSYPDWDAAMDHVEGKLALGETVKFYTKLSDRAFPVKVTLFEPNRKMVLTGGMPFGLFKSERTHTLTPSEDGHTAFHTKEIFSGILLPLFGRNLPDLTENFESFAAALKKQAEAKETAS
ncbi:MAG: SRPBCC domain-containing protein [Candidatus Promineifilaceae bacterium]|nr:SRPBCC domain-containing protein [Candidatus Promineifilaceae bacterium]